MSTGARGLLATLIAATPHPRRVIWTAIVGIITVLAVGLIVRSSDFDFPIVKLLNGQHHDGIATLTNSVYKIFEPGPAIVGTVILTALIIALTRDLRVASTFAVTIAATWIPLAIIKLIASRPRPDASLLAFPFDPAQTDASYPSGHAAFVTALVVTVVLGVTVGRSRVIVGIIGGLLILGVGLALLIDGLHYPSDVIASVVWGITVAPLVRMIWVSVVLGRLVDPLSRTRRSTHSS